MKIPFSGLIAEWKELERFNSLNSADRSIVFYAEDSGSWVHLGPIVEALIGSLERTVCYLTSNPKDPVLQRVDSRIRTFSIGLGPARTSLFRKIQSGVMVITMPDRQKFHFKRTQSQVQYVYVHHSMVSTHMIYTEEAFDEFDTIFCVGPHHKAEIEEREALHGLASKNLVEHGYGRLDSILKNVGVTTTQESPDEASNRRVLIAPSWGKDALLEVCGDRLIEVLLDSGYQVTIRPHPMTVQKNRRLIANLQIRFGGHPLVNLETDVSSEESLHSSAIMISDWSGAALEYAFGRGRPVLFIDVPRKVLNPNYGELSSIPIEVSLRGEIGTVLPVDALDQVPAEIERLCADLPGNQERLLNIRDKWVYNVGSSGIAGARYIAESADRVNDSFKARP